MVLALVTKSFEMSYAPTLNPFNHHLRISIVWDLFQSCFHARAHASALAHACAHELCDLGFNNSSFLTNFLVVLRV